MNIEQIAQRYMAIYHDGTTEQIMELLNKYPDHVISNEHMVILFVRIFEGMLNLINANPKQVASHGFIQECYRQNGPHIYLLKGFGSARGYRDLIRGLIKCNPDSISYHIDKDSFRRAHVLYERKALCHS